jgi:hypothetical protein
MIDNATRLRRLRNILQALDELDLDRTDLRGAVETLKRRAALALKEVRLPPGNPVNLAEARKRAYLAHRRKGKATEDRVLPILRELRAAGFNTYAALASELNKRGVRPPAAKNWSPSTVFTIEKRRGE